MDEKVLFNAVFKGVPLKESLKRYFKTREKRNLGEYLSKIHRTIVGVGIFMLKFYVVKKIFYDGIYTRLGFEKTILLLMVLIITILKVGGGAKQ